MKMVGPSGNAGAYFVLPIPNTFLLLPVQTVTKLRYCRSQRLSLNNKYGRSFMQVYGCLFPICYRFGCNVFG